MTRVGSYSVDVTIVVEASSPQQARAEAVRQLEQTDCEYLTGSVYDEDGEVFPDA
jgi:hypothetical protein